MMSLRTESFPSLESNKYQAVAPNIHLPDLYDCELIFYVWEEVAGPTRVCLRVGRSDHQYRTHSTLRPAALPYLPLQLVRVAAQCLWGRWLQVDSLWTHNVCNQKTTLLFLPNKQYQ